MAILVYYDIILNCPNLSDTYVKAVDSISKLGEPDSKESASNEAFYNLYL